LSVEAWRDKVGPSLKALGKLVETGQPSISKAGVYTVVVLPAKFEATWIDFTISVNDAGQIDGLYMKPGQAPKTTPAPTAPSTAPQAVKPPEERAREAVGWLMAEKYESLYEASTAEMQKAASVEMWRTKAGPSVKAMGKLLEMGKASISRTGEYTVVVLPAKFETTWWDFTVSVNDSGQIGGLYMKPGQASKTTPAAPQAVKPPEERAREVVALL